MRRTVTGIIIYPYIGQIFLLIGLMLFLASCSGTKAQKKDEGFDAERYMTQADMLISQKEYDEARRILLEVKNRDLSRKYSPSAQLKIADSYIKEGELDTGIDAYRKFLEMYPVGQYSSYAQYQIAMAYYVQIESPDRGAGAAKIALSEFLRLKEMFPRNPFREVVELRIEKCRNVIADGEFMIGEFYYKKQAYSAAAGRFQGILEQFPDYKRTDEVLFFLGNSYKNLKMPDNARDVFNELLLRYPSSKFALDVRKEVQKL